MNERKWIKGPGGKEWIQVLPVPEEYAHMYGLALARIQESVRHYHLMTRETYILIEGQLNVQMGFRTHLLKIPGEEIHIPPAVRHHAWSDGVNPAVILIITVPPWREDDHRLVKE